MHASHAELAYKSVIEKKERKKEKSLAAKFVQAQREGIQCVVNQTAIKIPSEDVYEKVFYRLYCSCWVSRVHCKLHNCHQSGFPICLLIVSTATAGLQIFIVQI